ncbi:MAG: DNA repair protein RadC [Prosthecobacter sp.]|nr:DNA repair protein RadC [Prosthecobacter sp.]
MNHRIHDMPEDDRPRERLLRLGPGALSDTELLAIFINTGIKGENAMQVGQRLLRDYGSLRQLARVGASELTTKKALGPAKAAHLAAAFELGRRAEQQAAKELPMDNPEAIYRLLGAEMQALGHESLRVVLLNTRLHLMQQVEVSMGTVNETVAHPRDILNKVITYKAYAFAVAHNHPSGDPTPSEADRRMTRRLKEGAELLGLVFMDHIIIGAPAEGRPQAYFSFKERGML